LLVGAIARKTKEANLVTKPGRARWNKKKKNAGLTGVLLGGANIDKPQNN
jgi:hypothetical protein